MTSKASIAELVQGLPPELYSHVHAFTFTLNSFRTPVDIGKDRHPPSIIQVNRATRQELAPRYYSWTKFELTGDKHLDAVDCKTLVAWLRSIPPPYLRLLTSVKLKLPPSGKDPYSAKKVDAVYCMRLIKRGLRKYQVSPVAGWLRVAVVGRGQLSLGRETATSNRKSVVWRTTWTPAARRFRVSAPSDAIILRNEA